MVSDKMVNACVDNWAQYTKFQRDHKQVTQAIIDAAWTKFDHNNEATWPSNDTGGLLVKCGESPFGYEVCWFEDGQFYNCGIPVRDPVEYCLLADLLPSEEE